uniref:Transcriptional regulator ICP22 homolog n=1 Tax=Macrostomum lignano TaxID=282301 RepID=A0A1I8FD48_9PLAT
QSRTKYGDVKLRQANQPQKAAERLRVMPSPLSQLRTRSPRADPGTEAGFLRVYAALQSGTPGMRNEGGPAMKLRMLLLEAMRREKEEKQADVLYEFHRKFLLEGGLQGRRGLRNCRARTRDATVRENLRRGLNDTGYSLARAHANDSKAKANGKEGSEEEDEEDFLVKRRPGDPGAGEWRGRRRDDRCCACTGLLPRPSDSGDGLEPNDSKLTEAERYLPGLHHQGVLAPRPAAAATRQKRRRSRNSEAALSEDEAFLNQTVRVRIRPLETAGQNERDPSSSPASSAPLPAETGSWTETPMTMSLPARRLPRSSSWTNRPPLNCCGWRSGETAKPPSRQARMRKLSGCRMMTNEAAGASWGGWHPSSYLRRIGDSLRRVSTPTRPVAPPGGAPGASRRIGWPGGERSTAAARDEAAELERRLERLRRKCRHRRRRQGLRGRGRGRTGPAGRHPGGDFLDEDFDPAEHDRPDGQPVRRDFYGEAHGDERRRRSRSSARTKMKARARPASRWRSLRRRPAGRGPTGLWAEDLIRAGPGRPTCRAGGAQRFPSERRGDSAGRRPELNSCVLSASQYREARTADWRDRRTISKRARAQERKTQTHAGMMKRLGGCGGLYRTEARRPQQRRRALEAWRRGELAGARQFKETPPRKKRKQQQQHAAAQKEKLEKTLSSSRGSRRRRRPPA